MGNFMSREFLIFNAAFSLIIVLYLAGVQTLLLELACLATVLLFSASIMRYWYRISDVKNQVILTLFNFSIAMVLLLLG
jgi:hypothetical protein